MDGKERSFEALEAGLQGALLGWRQRPELRCRDCGEMGYSPQHLVERTPGVWEVDQNNRLPKGWLSLEDVASSVAFTKKVRTILCPECRKKRSL